jgi:hypothetical protein
MTWVQYILTTLFAVSFAFLGNFYLQKRLISIKNKEKSVDILIDMTEGLKELYFKYWDKNTHCKQTSLKIKIEQTRLMSFLDFSYKKYDLIDKQQNKLLLSTLIVKATNDDFDSISRNTSKPEKSIESSKNCNNLIQNLFKNKI